MVVRDPLCGESRHERKDPNLGIGTEANSAQTQTAILQKTDLTSSARAVVRTRTVGYRGLPLLITSSLITVEREVYCAGRKHAETQASHPVSKCKQYQQRAAWAATTVLRLQAAFAGSLTALFPNAHIVPAVKREWLCRDPGYFEDFHNDPLTTDTRKVTARMGSETLRAMRALAIAPLIAQPDSAFSQIPVLFLIGSADRVVCQRQGTDWQAVTKKLRSSTDCIHCLLEDPEKDDVMRHLMQWLERRFPVRA